MSLPEICPRCGARYKVERLVLRYGTLEEVSLFQCSACQEEWPDEANL